MELIKLLVFIVLKLHSSSYADVYDCPNSCTCNLYSNQLEIICHLTTLPISIIPTNLSVPVISITSLAIWNELNQTFPTSICQYSQLTSSYRFIIPS